MHPQDTLLVTEALITFAGDPRDLAPREQRAWELAETLLIEDDLTEADLLTQIDENWRGPPRDERYSQA